MTNEQYAIAFEKGSPLRTRINTTLKALAASGILIRLQKRWLGTSTSTLPVLR